MFLPGIPEILIVSVATHVESSQIAGPAHPLIISSSRPLVLSFSWICGRVIAFL